MANSQPPKKGKSLAMLFFDTAKRNGNSWECDECNEGVSQPGSGYSNLSSHILNNHEEKIADRYTKFRSQPLTFWKHMTYPSKTNSIHAWIECVVLGLQPFNFVSKRVYRKHFKQNSISVNTLMKYLEQLTKLTEKKISDELPDKFSIIFDGWSSLGSHFVSIFASFPFENSLGYKVVLLAVSPMENEDSLSSAEHLDFLKYTLSIYGKSIENVVAMVGDNENTNKAFARLAGCPFIGCASHRFNLAMKDIISEYRDEITKVNDLMKKLSYQIPAAKLRRFTHLKAKISNETRWSSTYNMLKRYIEIKEYLPQLELPEIDELLLSDQDDLTIERLCQKFANLDSVTIALQDNSTTISKARCLFDSVIEDYPRLASRLATDAQIVDNDHFENAIAKIQLSQEHDLTVNEQRAVKDFKLEHNSQENRNNRRLSLAERAIKRHRVSVGSTQKSQYMDLRFLLATSNICERLFSIAGYATSDRRQGIDPYNLEIQLFLYVNVEYWDINEVHALVSKSIELEEDGTRSESNTDEN